MDNASEGASPPHAFDARLLRRLTTPLRLAGWSEEEQWYEEEELPADAALSVELSRSNFHLYVSWYPADCRLVVDDPTEGWDWTESLPPLFPLDEPLSIDLSAHPAQAAKAEAARRAFAAAGLLDATRIHLPEDASALRSDLVLLFWADHIHDTIRRHRRGNDGKAAIEALGEEFSWRIGSGLRAYPVIVPDAVPAAAARGIAEWCWRRESDVEKWHFKIDDIAMARANIAATRAVLPHVHPDGVDWPAVRLALTVPSRRLANGQSLQDIFEEGWTPILASIHREIDLWQQVDESLGPEAALRLLSMHGSRTESIGEWWGSGWYETMARRAVVRAASEGNLPTVVPSVFPDVDQFAGVAAGHPDLLDDDTFSWLTGAVFKEGSLLRSDRLPCPAAVTLPDWAVQDLLSVLQPDDEATEAQSSEQAQSGEW
ncbi:hypothetical protein [Streptomyces sp. NPDC048202]|uniref:hypothetical protein n=1 Tax=Streptomyces sp. NPDC048202 TaxID=3365514 RepID=UPI00371B1440